MSVWLQAMAHDGAVARSEVSCSVSMFLETMLRWGIAGDCLEGTSLETLGNERGFGLFKISAERLLDADTAREWAALCIFGMQALEHEKGKFSVHLTSEQYRSVQAVYGPCECMYGYAGTKRHRLHHVQTVEWLKKMLTEFHSFLAQEPHEVSASSSRISTCLHEVFNQFVSNLYEYGRSAYE